MENKKNKTNQPENSAVQTDSFGVWEKLKNEKKISENDPRVKKAVAKKKRKKYIRTPTHFLRLCIVWSFVLTVYFLSMPFMSVTMYIDSDLNVTTVYSDADYSYASQDEIDSVNAELEEALDSLELLPEDEVVYDSTEYNTSVSAMSLDWRYYVNEDIDYQDIYDNIQKSKALERNLYTEESLEVLANVTLKAQRLLQATVTISQSGLQLMFGGSIAESYGYTDSVGAIANSLYSFALAILPTIGFFAASFDKHKHIKHIISLLVSLLALLDILFIIYPLIDIGAVFSIIMYIIICIITVFSIYAKQQEDYIVKHPELEAEYSEKHPHFVKALINAKTFGIIKTSSDKKDEELKSAKNAQKRRRKKK